MWFDNRSIFYIVKWHEVCCNLCCTCFWLLLTLILSTWRIWGAPNTTRKWQMGFKSAFNGLKFVRETIPFTYKIEGSCNSSVSSAVNVFVHQGSTVVNETQFRCAVCTRLHVKVEWSNSAIQLVQILLRVETPLCYWFLQSFNLRVFMFRKCLTAITRLKATLI